MYVGGELVEVFCSFDHKFNDRKEVKKDNSYINQV